VTAPGQGCRFQVSLPRIADVPAEEIPVDDVDSDEVRVAGVPVQTS